MRVSEQELKCREAGFRKVEAGGFELTPFAKLTLDVLDHRRRIAELEQGIAAIGGAMGSDRLTPIEIERLIYKGNERSEQMQARIAELEAQLAQQKRMYEQEAKWRKAYQEAKGKMYAAGGELLEFAMRNMPCDEGQLDSWFRKSYVHRDAHDNLRAELEAQLAEARKDGENADEKSFAAWWMRLAEQLSGLEPPFREKNIAICLASAFRQGKRAAIAAAAAEGEKG